MDVEDDTGRADRAEVVQSFLQFVLQRLLHPARDRKHQRRVALVRVAQPVLELALDTAGALAVDVGEAKHVGGQAGLRIQPVGLALKLQPRLAEGIDPLDKLRLRAATKEVEIPVGHQHRVVGGRILLWHQLGQLLRQFQLVADDLFRLEADRPGIDRSGQRNAIAVDDVGAVGTR